MAEQSTVKKRKMKKQIVDAVTELEDGPGARGRNGLKQWKDPDVSEITAEVCNDQHQHSPISVNDTN